VEYLRHHGLPMSLVDKRVHMPVVEAFVKYVKPARLDDLLEVRSRISERRRASFKFSYEIRNESGELVATGFTRHACWDPATSRMVPIPDWLRAVMPDGDLDPETR
jgi:acyl-CoA thioester hydrolase